VDGCPAASCRFHRCGLHICDHNIPMEVGAARAAALSPAVALELSPACPHPPWRARRLRSREWPPLPRARALATRPACSPSIAPTLSIRRAEPPLAARVRSPALRCGAAHARARGIAPIPAHLTRRPHRPFRRPTVYPLRIDCSMSLRCSTMNAGTGLKR
jgi:hypothetical protein